MGNVIREGYGLKLTSAWPALHPDEIGWIPGPPLPTLEGAEERRHQGGHPEWYEIVPAAMDARGNVWEVAGDV